MEGAEDMQSVDWGDRCRTRWHVSGTNLEKRTVRAARSDTLGMLRSTSVSLCESHSRIMRVQTPNGLDSPSTVAWLDDYPSFAATC